jgi:RNA polymerase sigma-70 factor, ECF subfamily
MSTMKPETVEPIQPVSLEIQQKVSAAFRAYESRLFHAALRITRNSDDAWDAVQEAMVSALRHSDRFRGDAAVASWMYSIVVNAALYQRRRASARRRGCDKYSEKVWPEAELSLEAGTAYCDPESHVMARIDLERCFEHMTNLSSEKRDLLIHALDGDSCSELADTLNEPVAAVKSRLWRTRVVLRERMGVSEAA